MQDIECPYCEKWQEINHDDGYGYAEDQTYEQECSDCGQIFTYTTSISFSYEAYKAPCKNGGEHKLEKIHGYPEEFFEYKRRCKYCSEEVVIDAEKHQENRKKYFARLKEVVK